MREQFEFVQRYRRAHVRFGGLQLKHDIHALPDNLGYDLRLQSRDCNNASRKQRGVHEMKPERELLGCPIALGCC
jgi:hypothetical protein